ncbi:MAG: exodeoxyribonuclease VII small subunit [Elusimicrobia bacterium]|nr:exodeoxyribonuclease VII small subunit [Elusimicrobiota bacterium]
MTKKEAAQLSMNIKFEEALKKLEKIVEKLEGGDVPLEDSLALYEEGISLFRHCSSKLEEAKKKIEILSKKGPGGALEPEPFQKEKYGLAEEGEVLEDKDDPF